MIMSPITLRLFYFEAKWSKREIFIVGIFTTDVFNKKIAARICSIDQVDHFFGEHVIVV